MRSNPHCETKNVVLGLVFLKYISDAFHERHGFLLSAAADPRSDYYVAKAEQRSKVLGDETLRTIARELVETVKRNVTIDWTVKESARAKLRTIVKRILRKYGYPPDKQEKATQTVLEQAEVLCRDWAA